MWRFILLSKLLIILGVVLDHVECAPRNLNCRSVWQQPPSSHQLPLWNLIYLIYWWFKTLRLSPYIEYYRSIRSPLHIKYHENCWSGIREYDYNWIKNYSCKGIIFNNSTLFFFIGWIGKSFKKSPHLILHSLY